MIDIELIRQIGLILSWILQLMGLLIVLGSNLWFFIKARKGKFHSLKKEFVAETRIQWGMDDEKLQNANADETLKLFRIANLLYGNYRDSVIGVLLTLSGVVIGAAMIFA
jgi:hypothetical protein